MILEKKKEIDNYSICMAYWCFQYLTNQLFSKIMSFIRGTELKESFLQHPLFSFQYCNVMLSLIDLQFANDANVKKSSVFLAYYNSIHTDCAQSYQRHCTQILQYLHISTSWQRGKNVKQYPLLAFSCYYPFHYYHAASTVIQ